MKATTYLNIVVLKQEDKSILIRTDVHDNQDGDEGETKMVKQGVGIVLGVCSGNVQRSPTFEAVTNYELTNRHIDTFKADSAGSNVAKILANKAPQRNMVNALNAALHYGVVRAEIKTQVEHIVDQYDGLDRQAAGQELDVMNIVYAELRPVVHGMIVAYRNLALAQAHIPEVHIPSMYQAFVVDDSTKLVLAMDGKVLDAVRKELGTRSIKSMLYGGLVEQEPLEDDLKSGLEGAVKQVSYFMDTRKKAVEEMRQLVA